VHTDAIYSDFTEGLDAGSAATALLREGLGGPVPRSENGSACAHTLRCHICRERDLMGQGTSRVASLVHGVVRRTLFASAPSNLPDVAGRCNCFFFFFATNRACGAPPGTPVLANLEVLKLVKLSISAFPDSVAQQLSSLTHLDLMFNRFRRIPPAVSYIIGLRDLCMRSNQALKLRDVGIATLIALPHLGVLDIFKKCNTDGGIEWDSASPQAAEGLREQLPGLKLKLLDSDD